MNGAGASSGSGSTPFPANNFSPNSSDNKSFGIGQKPSTSSSSSSYLSDKKDDPMSNPLEKLENMVNPKFETPAPTDANSVLSHIPQADMSSYLNTMGNAYGQAFPGYAAAYGLNPMSSLASAYAGGMPYGMFNYGHAAFMSNMQGKKSGRMTYNRHQTSILESKFRETTYVSKKQREELHKYTGLSDRQIKIWFQNRRMKAKKEKDRTSENGEQCVPVPPSGPKMPPRDSCISNSQLGQVGTSDYASRSLKTEDGEGGSDTACTSSSSVSSGPIPHEGFGGFNWPGMGQDNKDMMSFSANPTLATPAINPYTYMAPAYPVSTYPGMYGYNPSAM